MDDDQRQLHDQFLRLFLEHEDSLRVFVRSLLFSQEEMREVMQEIGVVLWKKFDEEMDSVAFRRWAFGVAKMEVLAYRRDRARDRHCFGDDALELLAKMAIEEADELNVERQALEACLKKLRADQRELVQTAYAPGIRIDELAEQLGKTAMALYKKLHRIRLTLVRCTQRELARGELSC
ncbi:MAG: sigma-70 family RNA polymerase sigma factor [Verrucomicrobiota bacterium]